MPAGQISGKLNLNAAGWSSAVAKSITEIKKLQQASAAAGHGTVSSMQAASASIRLIEGDMTRNVRAVEKFITTIPGVGKALQAAFPLVGGLAFAGILVRIGKEAAEAVQKVQQAPQVISNAFRELNLSAESSIDSTRLATAKMQEQIALLTGHRPNTLAIELAEASVAADKLATSLANDNAKIAQLLNANGLSALSGFIGKAGTAEVGGSINSFDQQMSDLSARAQHATRTGDTTAAADLQKQLDDKRAAALAYANSQITQRQNQGPGGLNQDANISILTGFRNTLVDQGDQEQADRGSAATAAQLKKIQDAQKYADLFKKQQAELLRTYEEQEKQQNAFNKLTINEEIKFWSDRIGAFTKGGDAYRQVQEKIYGEISQRPDLTAENKKNQAKIGKSDVEGDDLLAASQKALAELNVQALERQNRAAERYNQITLAGAEIAAHNRAAFDEANVAIGLQAGTMSKLDAAQAMAGIHAREHADALAAVNRELQTQIDLIRNDPNPNLSDDDRAQAIQNAQDQAGNRVSAINGGYAVTQAQDQQGIASQQLGPAMRDALGIMVQDWSNMTTAIVATMTKAVDSLNDDLVKTITGHGSKADYGKTFTDAGQSLLKTSLQRGEGALLGAFGLGKSGTKKPTGAKGDPLHVIADTPGSGGKNPLASAASGLFRPFMGGGGSGGSDSDGDGIGFDDMLGGGKPNSWGSFAGGVLKGFLGGPDTGSGGGGAQAGDKSGGNQSVFGQLLGAVLGSVAGFAEGGNFVANRPMMVGERGPELLVPSHAGHIVPNHALGGGDTHLHFNIQGNQDPMAVQAAIRRAAPHIAAAAVQAVHKRAMRTPRGR